MACAKRRIRDQKLPFQRETVVAFGDSLVEGVGSTQGNDFVSLLSKQLHVPIVNLGHSGDTTSDALARINDVLSLNPNVVLVLLGGNDFLEHISKQEMFNNLEQIITIIQNKGALVILLGVRGGLITDSYESDLKSLAKRQVVVMFPMCSRGLLEILNIWTILFIPIMPDMRSSQIVYIVFLKKL
jgi:lysophospholipase L1-like esterase